MEHVFIRIQFGQLEPPPKFCRIQPIGQEGKPYRIVQAEAEKVYDLADADGIILQTQIPIVNGMTLGSADFDNHCKDQLKELIRQNYNHPSVLFWELCNELTTSGSDPLIGALKDLAHTEDPTRLASCARNNTSETASFSSLSDVWAYNHYMGWYGVLALLWPYVKQNGKYLIDRGDLTAFPLFLKKSDRNPRAFSACIYV